MRWPMLFLVVLLAADVSIGQDSPTLDASRPAESQVSPVASPLGRYGEEQWVSLDDLLHRIWSVKVSLAVKEAPLEEVLQTLADTLECQLRIDRLALEDREG